MRKPFMSILAMIAAAGVAVAGIPPRIPVVEQEAREVPPSSFDELWASADAVIRARVTSAETTLDVGDGSSSPLVITQASLDTTSVLKATRRPIQAGVMTVFQLGGTVKVASKMITVRDIEVVHAGRDYLLFLGWNPYLERWMVRGADGVYEIRASHRLRAYGHSDVARRRDGKTVSSVIDELRRLSRRDAVTRQCAPPPTA